MAQVTVLQPKRFPPLAALTDSRVVAPLIAVLILLALIAAPMIVMILASFRPAGVYPLDAGPWTFSNYTEPFLDPNTIYMLMNTGIFAGGVLLFGLPLAALMAFLTERTDMPYRHWVYVLMFIPMSTPVFATALGWILLLGPRAGTLNVWFRALVGSNASEGPFNIFSMWGLVFAGAIGLAPSMWVFLITVFRNMDPALEEAAAASGAGRLRTFRVITAPILRPGILAVAVYFFIVAIEALELPLALGLTGGIEVLGTRIFKLVNTTTTGEVQYGLTATLGMLMLIVGIAGITMYLYLVRHANRYSVMTGKGYRPRMIKLGRWRYAALAVFGVFLIIKVILPFSILLYTSFLRFYQPFVAENFEYMVWTLDHYKGLFDYRFVGKFFLNTVVVSVASATVTMILVSFVAWLVVRMPGRLTNFVNALAFMPLAIPGTISTVALLLLFIGTPVYGTLALLTFAYVFRFTAFGTRLMHAAQLQVHRELEEVALTSGASRLQSFIFVNLRLLLPAFINGWLYVLVHAAKDFSVPLLLASSGSLLFANVIFGQWEGGFFPSAAAMMVVLVAANLFVVGLGRRWLLKAVGSEH